MRNVVVIGSSNTDLVTLGPALPAPGQTVLHDAFLRAAGGKGANQAVAAARAGAKVTFVAAIGDDAFGAAALKGFRADKIDTRFVQVIRGAASGVALIMVDARGENMIAVAPGANARLKPAHVSAAWAAIQQADVVLASLEVPLPAIERAVNLASRAGRTVIVNPAPAPLKRFTDRLLRKITYLTPNETEFRQLTGSRGRLGAAAKKLLKRGVSGIVLTRGSAGVTVFSDSGEKKLPAYKVKAVDTVGAGDAFNGAFAAGLAEGRDLGGAIRFAQAAAALAVTRRGAQPSMPRRAQALRLMGAR